MIDGQPNAPVTPEIRRLAYRVWCALQFSDEDRTHEAGAQFLANAIASAQSERERPKEWSPTVETFRAEMMRQFSNKLSMNEIANFSHWAAEAMWECEKELQDVILEQNETIANLRDTADAKVAAAKAKLEEAEWWAKRAGHIGPAPSVSRDENCEMCVRITDLRAELSAAAPGAQKGDDEKNNT